MIIKTIKQKMKGFRDSAGFDLSADIDSIKNLEDAMSILQTHKIWLEDLSNEAQRSVEDFEKELNQESSPK